MASNIYLLLLHIPPMNQDIISRELNSLRNLDKRGHSVPLEHGGNTS